MVVVAISLAFSLPAVAGASSEPADAHTQPIAVPVDPVACDGTALGIPFVIGKTVVIPMGKACPEAAEWLRWDDGHGATAGHYAIQPINWILHPDTPDLEVPSWQRVLPGRSRARLMDIEAALNTWDDEVIEIPLFDAARGNGDGREVEVVAVVPFRLDHAYLSRANEACGHHRDETCLVGRFEAVPTPSPSGTPVPTPCPTARPRPSPRSTATPMPSASPSAMPTPTANPSPSETPTPSPSGSGEPTPSPSGSGEPTPSPPPDAFLALSVPENMAIPLTRNVVNGIDVPVAVRSNRPWTLFVADLDAGLKRGHMVSITGEPVPLADAMTASVAPPGATALDGPDPVRLTTGSGTSLLVMGLRQAVGPVDPPGTYVIHLTFTAIAGF